MFLGDWAAPSASLNQFCQKNPISALADQTGALLWWDHCLGVFLSPLSLFTSSPLAALSSPSPRKVCPLFYNFLLPPTERSPVCQPLTAPSVLSHPPPLCFCQSFLVFPSSFISSSSASLLHHHGIPLVFPPLPSAP